AVAAQRERRQRLIDGPNRLAVARRETAQPAVDRAHDDHARADRGRREHLAADGLAPELLAVGGVDRDQVAVGRAEREHAVVVTGPGRERQLRLDSPNLAARDRVVRRDAAVDGAREDPRTVRGRAQAETQALETAATLWLQISRTSRVCLNWTSFAGGSLFSFLL